MLCPFIFVYGTLRRKSDHPKAEHLREHARFLGEGTIAAQLYDLGPYPGIVASKDGTVCGDLFEMEDSTALLEVLDEYENAATGNQQLFKRELTGVTLTDGVAHEAWVYWYMGDVASARRIDSGRWF